MSNLQLEAKLRCSRCNRTVYNLFRRPIVEGGEVFQHVLWPAEMGVPPPDKQSDLRCPCGKELERVAA